MSAFVIGKIIGLSGSFVGLSGFWLIIGFLVENLNDMCFLAFKKFLALKFVTKVYFVFYLRYLRV
jgi:hypothetical protein